jgi:Aldo/keto reductase family
MQLAGDGVFGPPRDRDEALRVLRAAVAAGVDHIDTAQFYGAGTVNELIRAVLYPSRRPGDREQGGRPPRHRWRATTVRGAERAAPGHRGGAWVAPADLIR